MATIVATASGGTRAWSDTATWVGGVVPVAADNVQLDATSGPVTVAAAAVCRSLDASGYTATLTHAAAVTLTIGDATPGTGNVALLLVAGMTYTLGSVTTSALAFVSTSTTQQTITTGGKILGNWGINGAGCSYLLGDANTIAATATATVTLGTFNTGGQSCVWGFFNSNANPNVRTLTFGASAIELTGTGTVWNVHQTTVTMTANTAVVTLSGVSATFSPSTGANQQGMSLVFTGAGAGRTSAGTVANLTRIATATKICTLLFDTNITVTGTFTVTGNSPVNRVLVAATTTGTTRTVTAAAVALTYADFTDIAAAGVAAPFGGTSIGNALGNTGITFDAPATQTHTASAGGNWSDVTKWTSRVPLPQDNVIIDVGTTGTLTADMPRLGADVDFSGFTGTASFASTPNAGYGSLTLAAGMTVSGTQGLTLSGRAAHTLTSAGKPFTQVVTVNGPVGTYTLQDALVTASTLTVTNGTLNTNGQTATALTLTQGGGTLTLGASTINLTSTAASSIVSITAGTVNPGTSNIVVAAASTLSRTFAGGGKTFGTLTYIVPGSTGALVITGANTFGSIVFSDPTAARTLTFPASTVTTITGLFNVQGAPGLLATINSSTASTAATLTKTSGAVNGNYLSVRDITAGGGASWHAGGASTNVSGNTGWFFNTPSRFLQFI